MLTNQKDADFTITELEVWEVQFLVINIIKLNKYRIDRDEIQRKRQRQTKDK